jgi:hypothetical protein
VAYIMHADFKRCFLQELMSASAANSPYVTCRIYNTAVSVVHFRSTSPNVSLFNSTTHLSDDLLSA